MSKRVWLISGAFVIVLLTTLQLRLHFIHIQSGSIFFLSSGYAVDLTGEVLDFFDRNLRDCSKVQTVSVSSDKHFRHALKPIIKLLDAEGKVRAVSMLVQGDWGIVEPEYDLAEPAIYLLKKETVEWTIRGSWGGTPAPHKANPLVRRWLFKDAPDAPKDFMRCFEVVPSK